jgi:hypothetical protein
MSDHEVFIVDATTLISLKTVAEIINDDRVFNSLISSGRTIITTTVRDEELR